MRAPGQRRRSYGGFPGRVQRAVAERGAIVEEIDFTGGRSCRRAAQAAHHRRRESDRLESDHRGLQRGERGCSACGARRNRCDKNSLSLAPVFDPGPEREFAGLARSEAMAEGKRIQNAASWDRIARGENSRYAPVRARDKQSAFPARVVDETGHKCERAIGAQSEVITRKARHFNCSECASAWNRLSLKDDWLQPAAALLL